jgi:hypothetical protein
MAHPIAATTMGEEKLRNFRRVFEDNERVWFHPNKGLIAVWYGGATVNIYDADTFEEVDMFTQSMAFEDYELEKIETAIGVRLAQDGFIREGRGTAQNNHRTTVTER